MRQPFAAREVAVTSNGNGHAELSDALGVRGLRLASAVAPELLPRWIEEQRRLRAELGLDHFEGRSWRGFHHHACLVALAQRFLCRERECVAG